MAAGEAGQTTCRKKLTSHVRKIQEEREETQSRAYLRLTKPERRLVEGGLDRGDSCIRSASCRNPDLPPECTDDR